MSDELEMIENAIYVAYRTHYNSFGPTWERNNEGPELAFLWSRFEELVNRG